MCILQPDHCAHHWSQISSTLPQQGQSHMDSEHFPTRDPSTGTGVAGSIRTVEEKDTFQRHLKTAIFSAECISTLFHYHFILLFIITSCVNFCSVLFPCDCLAFWSFVIIVNVSLVNTYYVLCMCCHFLLLTNLSTCKALRAV